MVTSKIIETGWFPEKKLLVTHISGDLDTNDIETWEKSFKEAFHSIEDNGKFKIFVNMHGFKATDIGAHKKFRTVIPMTLADYGWKVGYLNLFEDDANTMIYKNERGIQCVAAAHAHHDTTKMDLYETRFSSDSEHFFTDPAQALQWIENMKIL